MSSRETTSWLFVALNDWRYPVSREYLATADLIDQFVSVNSKRRPKPYPRPWRNSNETQFGRTTLTPSQAMEVLRKNRG
ncbi:hypothetical protein [Frondihabitans sp. VKM Ac-2883]|uniref:hypothetical protein n=1 Tax=Frondihabitans sp. VKM Ac-2883 TaxID=2783823 RepID=UPI00188A410C|nr:hypothetical protein [Frondihabitans sp. VKM Ac-2883]MBF4574673.1 hypothetical protein [Frondihabitans sp. VKM Ac-2883]